MTKNNTRLLYSEYVAEPSDSSTFYFHDNALATSLSVKFPIRDLIWPKNAADFSEDTSCGRTQSIHVRFYDTRALRIIGNSYNVVVVYCSYYFVHCQQQLRSIKPWTMMSFCRRSLTVHWRCCCLMISALNSRSSCPSSSTGWNIVLCSWALTVSLSTKVY